MISHLKGKVSRQTFRDELVRMAASISDRYASATYLLERLGSAARQSRLHRAGT
jgi:TnpA family transposase